MPSSLAPLQIMLARMQSLLGPFPRTLLEGRDARKYVTAGGSVFIRERDLHDGNGDSPADVDVEGGAAIVGEHEDGAKGARGGGSVWPDSAEDPAHFVLLQPVRSSLRSRLPEDCRDDAFVEFLGALLSLDPDTRPTASQALRHPWLQATLAMDAFSLPLPPPP